MFDRNFGMKLLCVGLAAAVMLPAGSMLFPYVSGQLSGFQFQALEAVVSASIGFGIFALIS